MLKKTIISEFFTTVSFRQILKSLYLMTFGFYKLKYGKEKEIFLEKFLEKVVGKNKNSKLISFYNGRSAIFHCLKMIGVIKEDEIVVNAYNCVSVSNAVIKSGGKIIYSDIEKETLSFDFEILKKNINKNTKVIILQHTFGKIPRDYEKIINFAKENKILVIEDLAHSLGNNYKILGDFAIFSTGRDKIISSVTGGFLLINNEKYFKEIEKIKKKLQIPSFLLIFKNLNYNIFGYLSYKTYDFFKLGRIIIFLSRKFSLITEILTPNEKACNFDNFYLDFPNSLAILALAELNYLEKYTKKRLENSKYYLENLKSSELEIIFKNIKNYNGFRFPILLNSIEQKEKILKKARKNNIILGTSWSSINIAPVGTNLENAGYVVGTCPIAEDISKRILTLANHKFIEKKDLDRVLEIFGEK